MTKSLMLAIFIISVCIGLWLDLGTKSGEKLNFRQSLKRTLFWVAAGLLFAIPVYMYHYKLHDLTGIADFRQYQLDYSSKFEIYENDLERTRHEFGFNAVIQFITGYFVEYSLSVDNLFVMMLIFSSFKVGADDQKRILIWGVLGAIIMRFLFIFIGGMLVREFHWVMYLFGGFLVYSGLKLMLSKDEDEKMDPESHPVVLLFSRFFRVTKQPHGGAFFIKENGKRYATALFVVLLVVEFTDVVFAVDSVPAIFGITRDPYLVFASNIFAIMGLRSLFFLLGHSMKKLSTLKYGLSLILVFIGGKMIVHDQLLALGFKEVHSLMVLCAILLLTYVSSVAPVWYQKRKR